MKKTILSLFVFASLQTMAQSVSPIKYYKDSTYVTSFTRLTGATSINNNKVWTDTSNYTIPIGFNFKFFGDSSTNLYMSGDNGSGANVSIIKTDSNSTVFSFIFPIASYMADRGYPGTISKSPLSYQLTGTAPNRKFTMEWRNAGFSDAITAGALQDSIDLQLNLFETSNIIEYAYGNMNLVSTDSILHGGNGPSIGLMDSIDISGLVPTIKKNYLLTNSPSTPTLDSTTSWILTGTLPYLTGNPTHGRVYRFTPTQKVISANINNVEITNNIQLINELNNISVVNKGTEILNMQLMGMNGKIISSQQLAIGTTPINTTNLANGIYLININNNKVGATYKFVK